MRRATRWTAIGATATVAVSGCVGLIGGDADEDPGAASSSLCSEDVVAPMPLRRMTRLQYRQTVEDLTGVVVDAAVLGQLDEPSGAFPGNHTIALDSIGVGIYLDVADTVAEEVDLARLASCTTEPGEDEADCVENLVRDFGLRAFRRPISDDEVARYVEVFTALRAHPASFEAATRAVVAALLASPSFLYLVEPEDAASQLDDFEVATRLSYFLWNTTPDDALLEAAAKGDLSDADAIANHAARMLGDPRARDATAAFIRGWLGLERLESAERPLHEGFPETRAAMMEDVVDVVHHLVQSDASFGDLFTAAIAFPSPALQEIYELDDAPTGQMVSLDPEFRGGVLTSPAWLAAHSHGAEPSPVFRGVIVREHLLCQELPPPPPGVDTTPPPVSETATARERFAVHLDTGESCMACHQLIDPIGLALERYDGFGAYREQDHGQDIDDSGRLARAGLPEGEDAFRGPVELGALLAESPVAQRCFAQQWMSFALRRPLVTKDDCYLDILSRQFLEEEDQRISDLIAAIVVNDIFIRRH